VPLNVMGVKESQTKDLFVRKGNSTMHTSTQIRLRAVCLVTAAILVGILIHGSAAAQIPVKPTVEPVRETATAQERFNRGVHNIAEAPLDFTATVADRFNGKRPRCYGLAILMSPIEGLARSLTRFVMGLGGVMTSPYAEGDTMMYEYEHGTSSIDPVLHKAGRGLYNAVKAPVDIPAAFVKRSSGERPRHHGYAVVSSPFEGALQGGIRGCMGLLETGLAPFPPYDVPFYEYDLGTSVFDPAFGKLGFGTYHMARTILPFPFPLPFIEDEEGGEVLPYDPRVLPDAWLALKHRVNGEKPAHHGVAILLFPFEGSVQAFIRARMGGYYVFSSPFPPYPTEPPYQYKYGASPVDGAIEGFMRGTENVVISPLELPMTMYNATRDRGLVYGSAYGLVMGPAKMVVRAGAGTFETLTNSSSMLYGMLFSWSPDFQPIEYAPVYEIGLGEDLPEMFRERPRLKRPVHQPVRQIQR